MKRLLVSMLLVVSCSVLFSQTQEISIDSFETTRSMFSLDAGLAADVSGGKGYSVFIKSAAYIGNRPFYYGFGSLLGTFTNTRESFFDTGLLFGYTNEIDDSNLYYDLFLDLLITGGRINSETSLYQAEAPALHLGFSLGFPASSNIDGALSISPVIRPYNLTTREWDFSRSYINLGLTLHIKSLVFGKKIPWSAFNQSTNLKGKI